MASGKLPPAPCHAVQGHVPKFLRVIFNHNSNINNRQLEESLGLKDKLSGTGPISFMDSLFKLSYFSSFLSPAHPRMGTFESVFNIAGIFPPLISTLGPINMYRPITAQILCKLGGRVCCYCSTSVVEERGWGVSFQGWVLMCTNAIRTHSSDSKLIRDRLSTCSKLQPLEEW